MAEIVKEEYYRVTSSLHSQLMPGLFNYVYQKTTLSLHPLGKALLFIYNSLRSEGNRSNSNSTLI